MILPECRSGPLPSMPFSDFLLVSCPESDKDANILLYSLEQSVRDDLAILRASPFIRKELAQRSVGFIYDLKTGELSRVN